MSDTPFPFSDVEHLDSSGYPHDDPPTESGGQPCECTVCAELSSLEQIEQEIICEILSAKRKMNSTHSAFIRTLPIEVKVKIFELCIQGSGRMERSVAVGRALDQVRRALLRQKVMPGSSFSQYPPAHTPQRVARPLKNLPTLARLLSAPFPVQGKDSGELYRAMDDILEPYTPHTLSNRDRLEIEASSIIEVIAKESHRWQDLLVCLPRAYLKLLAGAVTSSSTGSPSPTHRI
ncbi:hypothetical protein NLJ89_g8042 [Agrocybe chaxingu]|uniref:Uncharacterized protein n=1 Tax=Agrocybe chaxingu TaxID=84603 RepID=A0A9W8JTD4_9AGAR|nr:hypothetical protein NLJ89_g8042 [Agrocybe chaxingu]